MLSQLMTGVRMIKENKSNAKKRKVRKVRLYHSTIYLGNYRINFRVKKNEILISLGFKYFNENVTSNSLFIFSKNNKFRRVCYRMSKSQMYLIFNIVVILVSIINQTLLTFFDYEEQINLHYLKTLIYIEDICNSLIFLDGIIKSIAFGMISKENSYLNDLWKTCDFIFVSAYLIHQTLNVNYPQILFLLNLKYKQYDHAYSCRNFRIMKFLSIIDTFEKEKNAIYQSLSDILNISFVLLIFWFVFGIFGITLYKGKMGFCEHELNFGIGKEEVRNKLFNIIYLSV